MYTVEIRNKLTNQTVLQWEQATVNLSLDGGVIHFLPAAETKIAVIDATRPVAASSQKQTRRMGRPKGSKNRTAALTAKENGTRSGQSAQPNA